MKRNKFTVVALSLVTLFLMAGVGWCIATNPTAVISLPLVLTAIAVIIRAIGGSSPPGAS